MGSPPQPQKRSKARREGLEAERPDAWIRASGRVWPALF